MAGPAFAWFLTGLVIGLAISAFLFLGGYLPDRPGGSPDASPVPAAAPDSALIEDAGDIAGDPERPRFDFYTVLPEMEVVVPEQELSGSPAAPDGPGDYILQVGSFRNAADAEQMKARLALLGAQANVQRVTVNGAAWHRVRIGPVRGARRADELRRMLQDHGIDTLVMKGSS